MLKPLVTVGLFFIALIPTLNLWGQVGNETGNQALQELMKKADRNGDGQLDNAERAVLSKHLDDFYRRELAVKADKNGDGQLSVSERMALKEMIEKRRADYLKTIPGGSGTRTNPNAASGKGPGTNMQPGAGANGGNPIQFTQPPRTPEAYRGFIPGGLDGPQLPPGVRPGFTGKPEPPKPNGGAPKPPGK